MSQDEGPPRLLNERTGIHKCIRCLREVPAEEYFRNDLICDECASKEEEDENETMKDER